MPPVPSAARCLALFLLLLAIAAPAQTPTVTAFVSAPYATGSTSIRLGAPAVFSGRVLPADATGTLTLVIDGVPAQSLPLAPQTAADYVALGDSITYAGYIADPAQRYPALLAQALSLNLSSYAQPGATACDVMPLQILPNAAGETAATNPLSSLLIGTRDLAAYGTGAHEQVFDLCHQATLAWLGLPRASKILIGDSAAVIASGSWSPGSFNTLSTSTPGGTLRFTLQTSGSPAYLWYGLQSAASGSFTVSVDGGTPVVSIPTGASGLGSAATSFALLRIPVAAGTHTFDVGAQSGTVTILGMGATVAAGLPTVLAGDIPSQINGDLAGIAAYTADIQANIALLQSDGLDIRFVPTQQFMLGTPAEMMGAQNPNLLGLSELAQAFAAAITPSTPAVDATPAAIAAFTPRLLNVGTHSISMSYSGDSRYSPAASAALSFNIYDATSTTALASDSATYSVQSPIVLTASVPQPNASGLVTFVDQSGTAAVTLGSAWMNASVTGAAQLTLPGLPAGVHTIVAQYLGDILYNPSASAPVSVDVSGTYTATALSAPATRHLAAASIPLTASVTPASATGSVTFFDGASPIGQAALISGVAVLNTSALAQGIHVLTAAFNGNTTQDPSTSPALAIEIDSNSTTVVLTPVPAAIPYGTSVPLTATVSPATATGTVAFSKGSVLLGSAALTNGVATFTAVSLAPAAYTFTATYSGDAGDLGSVSAPVSTQITLAPTTVTLAPNPATAAFGSAIALNASVTPSAATGFITFADAASGALAKVAVVNGTATFAVASAMPGPHWFTATYSGDAYRAASASAAVATTVTPAAASIALAAPPATTYAGNPVVLSATVTPPTATGTVLFRDANLGVLGQTTLNHGTANLNLPSPAPGSYSVTAVYGGDADDSSATSAAVLTQVVLNPTTVAITASAATASFGTPIILNAALSPSATGSVAFFDGASLLGSGLVSNGSATFTASLARGSHTLHATYGGDSLNAPSTSAPVTVTIAADATITTLTLAQSTVIANASVIANIRVAAPNLNPTGSVTVRSGATVLALGPVGNASGGFAYATLSFPAATLGLGPTSLAAFYSGDSNDQSSDSTAAPSALTVVPIPVTATLALSATQIPIGNSVTLTASTSAPGTVTFLSNGVALASVALNASGVASYTFTASAIGNLNLTAAYNANGFYGAAVSAPQLLVVTPPVSAAFTPGAVSAGPGASASASLTLTPLSGFSGAIQATCAPSASFVSCSLTAPASLSSAVTIPVQVHVAQTSASNRAPVLRGVATAALALLLPVFLRRKPRRLQCFCALLVVGLALQGCAEGGDFNSIPTGTQVVTVTITAAGTAIPVTLAVNIP